MKKNKISPDAILKLGTAFMASKTLLSAIELGLFTELAKGPRDKDALRVYMNLHPRSVGDFLDALVGLGMLDCKGGKYRNTKESDLFLDRNKPSYVGGLLEMCNARLYGFWGSLSEGLKTGSPQNEAKGGAGSPFDAIYGDPEKLRGFLQAMTGLSSGAGRAIAEKFPWKSYKTFLDVGGAQGGVAVQLALAHKKLTGGNFDLPVVGPVFEEYVKSFKLDGRLKFYPGDFFKDPIPGADVIIMGHILHDWNLEEKKALIAKVYAALPKGGAYIIHEAIIDDARRKNVFGLLMSLNMLIETPGGFDYTGADCQGWLKAAGFRKTKVVPLAGPDSMVIGIK
ncbi:MAG TPA: methyltransferase [Planctomycetota bacterium]|nr:methyltransferase [Planctomycetota bacterium]